MKNITVTVVFIFFVFCVHGLQTQWQPDYRLTNSAAESYLAYNNGHCIAAAGDSVHVVFTENRDNLTSVFYKRSLDGGASWTPDILISGTLDHLRTAVIAVQGQRVHVAWSKIEAGIYEIYYRSSTNGGNDWRPVINIVSLGSISVDKPSIAVTGSYVHLTWQGEFSTSQAYISYRNSSNYGSSWGTPQQLTVGNYRGSPSVCASGDKVFIAFQDDQYGNKEISYMRSTNSGVSWTGGLTRLTNDSGASLNPSAAMSGDTVFVTWMDNRYGSIYQIFLKKSENGGAAWQADHKLTNSTEYCQYPNIAVSGTNVHLVWYRDDNGLEIFYLKGIYSGNSWQQITKLTTEEGSSQDPTIAVSGTGVHVIWVDRRNANKEIYYKRNPTGNTIGVTTLSTIVPGEYLLRQNYPNPFNPVTKIRFDVPSSEDVVIKIFDMLGREITTLVNEQLHPGTYETEWDAANYPSGIYFYRLITSQFNLTRKMVLTK